MYVENDHGLTAKGVEQAESLRARIMEAKSQGEQLDPWLSKFLQPDRLISSPFTRAMETAAIGLMEINVKNEKLDVLPVAREQRNWYCSADCVGIETGNRLKQRVLDDLRDLAVKEQGESPEGDDVLKKFENSVLDTSKVEHTWWSEDPDTDIDIKERLEALFLELNSNGPDSSTVLVGHSHYFRNLFQMFMPRLECFSSVEVVASLQMNLIPCCGVVGMKVEWQGEMPPKITEVTPLLDTVLESADMVKWEAGKLPAARNYCVGSQTVLVKTRAACVPMCYRGGFSGCCVC